MMASFSMIGRVLLLVLAVRGDTVSSCQTILLDYNTLATAGVTLYGTASQQTKTGGATDALEGSSGFWRPSKDVAEPSLNLAFYQNEDKVVVRSISFDVKRADSVVFEVTPKDDNEEHVIDVVEIFAPQDLQGGNGGAERPEVSQIHQHFSADLDVKEISITFQPSPLPSEGSIGMRVENMKVDFQRC